MLRRASRGELTRCLVHVKGVGSHLAARLVRHKLGRCTQHARAMGLLERTAERSETERTRRQVLGMVEVMAWRWLW